MICFLWILRAFYYTIANIKPQHRSHENAIELLALITASLLKRYGPDAILDRLMSQLQELEKVCRLRRLLYWYILDFVTKCVYNLLYWALLGSLTDFCAKKFLQQFNICPRRTSFIDNTDMLTLLINLSNTATNWCESGSQDHSKSGFSAVSSTPLLCQCSSLLKLHSKSNNNNLKTFWKWLYAVINQPMKMRRHIFIPAFSLLLWITHNETFEYVDSIIYHHKHREPELKMF